MKEYRSHKVVRAAKIERARRIDQEGAAEPHWALDLEVGGDGVKTIGVANEWLNKHLPPGAMAAGGYYVQYADGYSSWSPAEAFEAGYTEIEAERRRTIKRDVAAEAPTWNEALRDVERGLEPAATDLAMASGLVKVTEIATVSAAISAKRTADAMERIAETLSGNPYALNDLMENAGQAFAVGMRGRG